MFSKFSVKKPLTIFVSVLMVIILGFVSFSDMIPDLLPNINLPYAVVITAYPGATPEEVEAEITRPLEQSMASLENINSISSTSSDSVSQVMLEFTDTANMDVVVPEIREKINAVSGSWPDIVASPFILKLNPNLLPVVTTAANYEGKTNIELTEFVNEQILSELEGITGVASVDLSGGVEEQINVILSPEKIDALNKKIANGLEEEFKEAEEEMAEGEQELIDGLTEIQDSLNELDSAKAELQNGQDMLIDETTKAEAELLNQRFELDAAIAEIEAQITSANEALPTLELTLNTLNTLKTELDNLNVNKETANANIAELEDVKINHPLLSTKITDLEALIAPLELKETDGSITEEEQALLETYRADLIIAQTELAVLDAKLIAHSTDIANIDAKINEYTNELRLTETAITAANTALSAFGITDLAALDAQISELNMQLVALKEGIVQMEAAIVQMETGAIGIKEGLEELSKQQLSGALDMSAALTEITTGQSALTGAEAELESAKEQLETAKEDLEEQKESAIDSAQLEITMDMVNQILVAQNFSMPAGYITEDDVDYLVRIGEKVDGVEELNNLVLMNIDIDGVGKIRLSDVAEVFLTDNSGVLYSKVNGENGLIMSFSKQPTYATATVSENVNEKFLELTQEYEGLNFSNLMDQGEYIELVVDSVLESLIYGAILSIIILLLFLKDLRPTIIIAFSIPISLLFAMVLMYFSGVTLNIISLSGLAIGVGMLVDNSVVVIENIYRLRAEGVDSYRAAVKGATQVTGAITASTLTTVCVFLPIVFIEGLTRDLFTDMALTVAYSLLASLLVAITLVPAMASSMLRKEKERKDPIFSKLLDGYAVIARASLKHKSVVILLSILFLVGSAYLILARGFIFMPTMSSTEMTVSIPLPANSPFEDDVKLADEVYEKMSEIPELKTIGMTLPSEDGATGMMSMMGGGSDAISINCIMHEDATRKDSEVSADIEKICADLGLEASVSGASSMTSMLSSSGVSIKIYGQDLDNLIEEASLITEELGKIDGLAEINNGLEDTSPEIRITVDKEKAITHGLLTAQIYAEVAEKVATETTSTKINIDNYDKDIIIYSEENQAMTLDKLENLVIEYQDMAGEKKAVRLDEIAKITYTQSLNSVSRDNQRRTLTVTASLAEGHNITLVTNDITAALNGYETLPGNTIEIGGENDDIMEAMEQLIYMFLLAIVIIYFIMVAQFQSLKFPFIVMFTIPLATTGGFLALLMTGHEISVVAMVGFVMLSGIIVNNGIVLIDYINILRIDGMEKREAIVLAGKTRMRPILMTALTTVLGLVFMAIGTGVGTEMMQPIAIVCIGGLLYATLMTLFVVPAMYDILSNKEVKVIDVED